MLMRKLQKLGRGFGSPIHARISGAKLSRVKIVSMIRSVEDWYE